MGEETRGAGQNRKKDKTKARVEYSAGDIPVLGQVSFITTVYNEEDSIIEFLQSLRYQTVLPGEMIIVDGGSTDRTFDLARDFLKNWAASEDSKIKIDLEINEDIENGPSSQPGNPAAGREKRQDILRVRLLRESGAGIARGRNTAISRAKGKYICVSDAGCRIDPDWLKEITAITEKKGDRKSPVIGGMNYADCESFLQRCQALCMMPGLDETDVENFMPSSRNICFKKEDWKKVGGYPEDLDYGEDMKYNFNLKEAGCRLLFNPEAIVHWKMREDLDQIFRQFFRYAKGDALGRMYPVRHLIRFLTGLGFLAVMLAAVFFSPYILFSFILLFAAYSFRPYRRMFAGWRGNERCRPSLAARAGALFLIPFLLIYIDTAKVLGYIYGLIKR